MYLSHMHEKIRKILLKNLSKNLEILESKYGMIKTE